MVCVECTVFMYLELSLNQSQGISLDENLFNGLKNPCCVTTYPFPATILYKFVGDVYDGVARHMRQQGQCVYNKPSTASL